MTAFPVPFHDSVNLRQHAVVAPTLSIYLLYFIMSFLSYNFAYNTIFDLASHSVLDLFLIGCGFQIIFNWVG